MKRLYIAAAIASLLTVTACSEPSNSSRIESTAYSLKSGGHLPDLQKGLKVTKADLSFSFDFDKQVLFGSTELTMLVPAERNQISVDLDNRFTINSILVDQQPVTEFKNENGELKITLPNELSQKEVSVLIDYQGMPRVPVRAPWDGGVMWEKTPSGQPWLATAVQGEGCDLFWPCIDHPTAAPKHVDLHITVPNNLVAASNGKLLNIAQNSDSTRTFHWQTKTNHTTYGIALNIAPYEEMTASHKSIYGNDMDVVFYHLPERAEQAKGLFAEIPTMIDFFERMIGPYPFASEKVGVVETPHLGMEHQTINAYGNQYKKDGHGFDWLLQHEFAHEWFGNQVTNTDWDHMWIHEGFGSYMQPLYAQYLYGDLGYYNYLQQQRESIVSKFPLVSNQIKEVEEVYSGEQGPGIDIYYKGSWLLHTLRNLIGDTAFFDATRVMLYDTKAPKPGEFSPVYRDTQDVINIFNKVANRDLNWFFDVYLFSAALPELKVERTDNEMSFKWQTENNLPFPMPLEVKVNNKVITLDMENGNHIKVDKKDIVIVDPRHKILMYQPHIVAMQQARQKK